MQKNPYIFDNFSDNSLHKFWDHYEKKFTDKHENGNGVVKENVKYEEVNISNQCDKEKIKKCLVLEAHGDLYEEDKPKGLKLKPGKKNEYIYADTSKRVGSCIRTKKLLGPGEFEARIKITSSKMMSALWTFQYEEFDMDDYRHRIDKRFNKKNDVNGDSVLNHEIDIEYPGKNEKTIKFNNFISTEHPELYNEEEIEYKNLVDNDWHVVKFTWETSILPIKEIIGRDLTESEVILVNRTGFIYKLNSKKYKNLNGMYVKKHPKYNNEYVIIYGSKIEYYIDDMNEPKYTHIVTKEDIKKGLNKRIPNIASHFYMAVWFSSAHKDRNFDIGKMYVDYFKYTPNNNEYTFL